MTKKNVTQIAMSIFTCALLVASTTAMAVEPPRIAHYKKNAEARKEKIAACAARGIERDGSPEGEECAAAKKAKLDLMRETQTKLRALQARSDHVHATLIRSPLSDPRYPEAKAEWERLDVEIRKLSDQFDNL